MVCSSDGEVERQTAGVNLPVSLVHENQCCLKTLLQPK